MITRSAIDRRSMLGLAAATGAALAVPRYATASTLPADRTQTGGTAAGSPASPEDFSVQSGVRDAP